MDLDKRSAHGRYEVFISYLRDDLQTATALALHLRAKGHHVFLASDSLDPGVDVGGALREAISNASAVVLMVSHNHSSSSWAGFEMDLALERARSDDALLVPIWLPGASKTGKLSQVARFHGVVLQSAEDTSAAADAIHRSLVQRDAPSLLDQQRSAALLEGALADSVRVLGADDPSSLSTRASLANVYLQLNRRDEAAALLEGALADSVRVLGADDPTSLSTRANLANVYLQLNRRDEVNRPGESGELIR